MEFHELNTISIENKRPNRHKIVNTLIQESFLNGKKGFSDL